MARQRGTVKWFNDAKGYGFITPKGGHPELFVHYTAIESVGFKSLKDGQEVEFEITDGNGGKKQASKVVGL